MKYRSKQEGEAVGMRAGVGWVVAPHQQKLDRAELGS